MKLKFPFVSIPFSFSQRPVPHFFYFKKCFGLLKKKKKKVCTVLYPIRGWLKKKQHCNRPSQYHD